MSVPVPHIFALLHVLSSRTQCADSVPLFQAKGATIYAVSFHTNSHWRQILLSKLKQSIANFSSDIENRSYFKVHVLRYC